MAFLIEHNWLGRTLLRDDLQWAAQRYARGRLLDVGCAEKPYAPLFDPFTSEHVGVDVQTSPHKLDAVDYVIVDEKLPFPDASFDTVLCTQVLEHTMRPATVIFEAFRVLRPGGHYLLSAPHIWDVHEAPYDFWRFTEFGLRLLLTDAGFEVVEVRPEGGYWVTAGQRFSYFLNRTFENRGKARRRFAEIMWSIVQRWAMRLDRRWPYPEETENYFVVAKRPEA